MNVTIAPAVALEEAHADDAFHKNRCLILRQALADTEAARAALEKERDELKAHLAEQTASKPKTVDPVTKKKGAD